MIVRCTNKMLGLIGTSPGEVVRAKPADADWYANLFSLNRRRCLLLAHAGTLFSVVAADVREVDLLPIGRVVGLIRQELTTENLPEDCLGELDPESIRLARTASRSVLGYMNEMVRYCRYAMVAQGAFERLDIKAINRDLRRELHLSRQPPGYFVPIALVRERVASLQPNLKIVT